MRNPTARATLTLSLSAIFCLATTANTQQAPTLQRLSSTSYAYISSDDASANGALYVGNKAAMLVDPGHTPAIARAFFAAAERLSPVPIRYVLITHWHPDHGLGLAADMEREFTLISHPLTRRALAERGHRLIKTLDQSEELAVHRLLANKVISERETIDLGGLELEIIHFGSAHTHGDLAVWSESDRILVTGDLFLRDSSPDIGGGNVENWIKALADLGALDPAIVVPGHFALSDATHMARFRAYLESLLTQMEDALQSGVAASEAAKNYDHEGFADFRQYPRYGATFANNARAVAAEIQARPPQRGDSDPFTLNKILDVGRNPHQINFSADGNIAYIAAAGSNRVARVSTASLEVLPAWDAADSPLGVALQPASGKLLVTHFGANAITIHDSSNGKKLATLQTGAGPSLFSGSYPSSHETARNRLLLVAERANRLWVLDSDAFAFVANYPTGKRPFPPAATSDGRKAFVPNYDDGTITIVDLWNDAVLGTTKVGAQPSGGIVLPGDIDYAVAVRGEDHIAFINSASQEVVGRLRDGIGKSPFSVVLSPGGEWAFVNNTASHDVSAIRLIDRKVIARIPTGEIPICMAVHPSGETLWIGCEGTHDLYVIDIPKAVAPKPIKVAKKTQVAVLGMIHGRHRQSKSWGHDQLHATIEAIKPDAVLTEIAPDRWQRIWSGWSERGAIEDSRIERFPEYTDVLLPLQLEMGFVIEPTAGWTQEMSDLRQDRIATFGNDERFASISARYQQRLQEVQTAEYRRVTSSDDPHVLHSDRYDRLNQSRLRIYDDYLNDWIGPGGWTNINKAHMKGITDALARHRGERVLITYGAGHKYWITKALQEMADVELIDVAPFLPKAEGTDMKDLCHQKVLELHRFFQDWFTGELADTAEAFARFSDVINAEFEIISPAGVSRKRSPLMQSLRAAHGSDPESKIWIENFQSRQVGEGLLQTTYEEWQGRGDNKRGRLSSALFRRKSGLPNDVEWLHLHEGWLPKK